METYIPNLPARTVQRNLINTVRQNKQQLSFTDNRPVAVSQRKTLQSMGQQKPMQMKRTETDMVRNDLTESPDMRRRFFTSRTRQALYDITDNAIQEGNIPVDYRNLGGININKGNISTWLKGNGEHIYVWQGGQLIGGNNLGGEEKICHPNLIGGDPDVDYAGTFKQSNLGWKVTYNSGHFQFPANYSMQAKIAKYANEMTGQDLFDVQY